MAKKLKIIYLDAHTLNPGDLSWEPLSNLGDFEYYDYTEKTQVIERAKEADILLSNKTYISAETMDAIPNLKCICVTATGYNNVDLEAAKTRGIKVCNAVGYSTPAVAQHVFALIFALTSGVEKHNQSVKAGKWAKQIHFAYWDQPIIEINGQTMGIYGFGRIGREVGKIAQAFGMKVLAHHKHPERDAMEGVEFVSLDTLFEQSDILSLHAPLSSANKEIVNRGLINKMKPNAMLINTGRGGLIHEEDLAACLLEGRIKGAALDVLSKEPPPIDHPLIPLENCIITPHQAWASIAARQRLLNIVAENIKAFVAGQPQNVLV